MTSIVNDAILLLQILTELTDPTSRTPLERVKAESGLDEVRFEKAKEYLMESGYIKATLSAGGTTGSCWMTSPGITFLNDEMQKRINLSLTAQKIAQFLSLKHPQYSASADEIKETFGLEEDDCQKAIIELIDEGLAEDFLKSANTPRISVIKLISEGRKAVRNNFVRQFGGTTIMENNKFEVSLGDGNVIYNSNLVAAEKIKNSFNEADSAEVSDELKNLLKELALAVAKMSEELSPEEAEQVARDLETLTAEATSKKPREKWWQLSVEDLQKAAENVGKVGVPVITLAAKIAPILYAMSQTPPS